MQSAVLAILNPSVRLSVSPSVRPSVTVRYHVKITPSTIMRSYWSARFGRPRSFILVSNCQSKAHMRLYALVRHRNLGPVLHRFGDIASF